MWFLKYVKPFFVLYLLCLQSYVFPQDNSISMNHYTANGFKNPYPTYKERSFADILKWLVWDKISGKKPARPDYYDFKAAHNDGAFLRNNRDKFTITWIGHSTVLLQLNGVNILTDPIWSERASPFSFIGPKRYMPPGVSLKNLPDIDIILISHNHYDHLDLRTIRRFGNDVFYLVPLGIGKYLDALGITRYIELDWWDEFTFNDVRFCCTPAQHESGRFDNNDNTTLWCGWAVLSPKGRFYFAGDTGYFAGFKEIGNKYGPFDAAALPIGAYLPRWFMEPVHTGPKEAVQAMEDVKADNMLAVHWGTFELGDEPLDDPPKRLMEIVKKRNLDEKRFWIFDFGETRIVKDITLQVD